MGRRGRPRYPDILTPREWEVLDLLRAGLSNEEIAQRLGISLSGAKYHVSEILSKLGVSSREEAARWSAPGGDRRPWWLAAVAPASFLWRRANASWVSTAVAAGVAIAVGAGIGLLVWGLVRTDGGGDEPGTIVASTTPGFTLPKPLSPPTGAATATSCPSGAPPPAPDTAIPSLAYAAPDDTIWVVSADGANNVQLICDAIGAQNAAWSPSGRYLAHASPDGSLWVLNLETGQDTVLDDGTTGQVSFSSDPLLSEFQWSPVEDALIYEKFAGSPRPLPLGIWRVSPDAAPVALVQSPDVWRFAWSPNGERAVYEVLGSPPTPPSSDRTNQLHAMNADGSGLRKLTDGILIHPDPWSPDGRFIAYWKSDRGGSSTVGDIYVMNVDTGREFSLGEFTSDEHPQWSPDRSRYVFYNLAIAPDTQSAVPLFDRPSVILDWSLDGSKAAYVEGAAFGPPPRSLVVLDINSGERTTFHTSNAYTAHAGGSGYYGQWSPDSRYYAFAAVESASTDVLSQALYIADTQSGEAHRILDGVEIGQVGASYSPDGSYLLIQRGNAESSEIWIAGPDGSHASKIVDGVALSWRPAAE